MDGIVVSFDRKRGFGFIQPLISDLDAEQVFFHVSLLANATTVPLGVRVGFVLVDGKGGRPQAAQVRLRQLSGKALTGGPRGG